MDIIANVLSVFTSVSTWMMDTMEDVIGLFWNATEGLTFFGLLALIPLGISVVLLLFQLVKSYLNFRA